MLKTLLLIFTFQIIVINVVVVFGGIVRDHHMHPDLPPTTAGKINPDELESSYWLEKAKNFVNLQIEKTQNKNVAKNIILFLGDGMSLSTIAATRMYQFGSESHGLFFEEFPYFALAKTYCVDFQVADSACTATAYLTGVKGNFETVGLDATIPKFDCNADPAHFTHSLAKWAIDAGKSAGIVTTARITDASPAGVYAHAANREWENDIVVERDGCDSELVDDIAEQLVFGDVGMNLKVILGGGRREMRDLCMDDEEGGVNRRNDGKDLIESWLSIAPGREYVWNRTDLLNVDPLKVERLLGLFEPGHLQFNLDVKEKEMLEEPTLSEMLNKAMDILSTNENGYFLFVEGGRIDHAHHNVYAHIAFDETAELAKAVELARSRTSESDTLIVVTADHSHVMTYSGYAPRGNDIFGTAGISPIDEMSYLTVSYANGFGHDTFMNSSGGRIDPNTVDLHQHNLRFPTMVDLEDETHGGDDVGVYASGPWAQLFTKTIEQSAIPHFMAYASCIGNGKKACH